MNRRQVLIGGGAAAALSGGGILYQLASDTGWPSDYDAGIAPLRSPLPDPAQAADLIRYATLAPSGHNTQPWKFRVRHNSIRILPDLSRRTPIVDPDDHHLFVSLGCAAENLSLASAARGHAGTVDFDPADGGSIIFDPQKGQSTPSPLFDAISMSIGVQTGPLIGAQKGPPVRIAHG